MNDLCAKTERKTFIMTTTWPWPSATWLWCMSHDVVSTNQRSTL